MYKILAHKHSTVPLLVMDKIMIQSLALVTVAIETGIGWKAYQAVIPYHENTDPNIIEDPDMLQGIAGRGRKLLPELARTMFPQFDQTKYNK